MTSRITTPPAALADVATDIARGQSFGPGLQKLQRAQRHLDHAIDAARSGPFSNSMIEFDFESSVEQAASLVGGVSFPGSIGHGDLRAAAGLVSEAIERSVRADMSPVPEDRAAIIDALIGARSLTVSAERDAKVAVADFGAAVAAAVLDAPR